MIVCFVNLRFTALQLQWPVVGIIQDTVVVKKKHFVKAILFLPVLLLLYSFE